MSGEEGGYRLKSGEILEHLRKSAVHFDGVYRTDMINCATEIPLLQQFILTLLFFLHLWVKLTDTLFKHCTIYAQSTEDQRVGDCARFPPCLWEG